jgi:putative transcription factor
MKEETKVVCDMCGSNPAEYKAVVEGTELFVCSSCAGYGKVVSKIETFSVKPQKKAQKQSSAVDIRKSKPAFVEKGSETIMIINPGYANIVKKAREKRGLKQEEVAKLLNEKESVIHQIERGSLEPNLNLARKLEKFFHVSLVEQHEESPQVKTYKTGSKGFTVADFLKKR